jgi:hypothetical protein
MICKNCKNEIASDSKFCPNCGFKNEQEGNETNTKKCVDCGKEFPENRFFCDACGGMLSKLELQEERQPSRQFASNSSGTVISSGQSSQLQDASSSPVNGTTQQGTVPQPPYSSSGTAPQQPDLTNAAGPAKKKKSKSPLAVFLIACAVTFAVSIVIFGILVIIGMLNSGSDYTYDGKPAYEDGAPSKTDAANTGTTGNQPVYEYKYSYAELPDVVSIDSDKRFIHSANYSEQGVTVYTYLFYDKSAVVDDFYQACDDYSELLQEMNGFIYNYDLSQQKYEETGERVIYLTREDYLISITASLEDSLCYAYIAIAPIGGEENTQIEAPQVELNMPNYNKFLADREIKYFDYAETVNMENGLTFFVYDVIARMPGDGTLEIDINLDLGNNYADLDYYMNNGDIMILPMDGEGNILSDAVPTAYVKDSEGNSVAMPFLTNTSVYENYTFTYIVPPNTIKLSIYASNVAGDDFTGPVYVMNVE